MTNKAFILSASAAVLLTGCATRPPAPVVVAREPAFVPIESLHNVRVPEDVKAYPIDRYIDPNEPDLMHERHVVYRIERPADWRLETSSERQILVGNTMTDSDLSKTPVALQDELSLELAKQRLYSKARAEEIGQLIASVKTLENRALQAEIATSEAKRELEKTRLQLQKLEVGNGTNNAAPPDAKTK